MKKPFKVYLKAGERLFVNGAVLRVDRKVSIAFLNDVAFLLESNVLQADEATTPLRQLYFVVQAILIDKGKAGEAWDMYTVLHDNFIRAFDDESIREGLAYARDLALKGKLYDALRAIRPLFAIEDALKAVRLQETEQTGAIGACR